LYTITVRWLAKTQVEQAVYSVPEYEVKDGVLTLAIDHKHDLVIPLFDVATVDIQRQD
jgi:hypothetical protein